MKIAILFLLFLTSCSSIPKNNPEEKFSLAKEDPIYYDSLCYSFEKNAYGFFPKGLLVNRSEKGISLKFEDREDPTHMNANCILERSNFAPKLTGKEPLISFFCALDDIGDNSFSGESFVVLEKIGEEIVSLYDVDSKREFLVWVKKCTVLNLVEPE